VIIAILVREALRERKVAVVTGRSLPADVWTLIV
jgi:hypothetical protein